MIAARPSRLLAVLAAVLFVGCAGDGQPQRSDESSDGGLPPAVDGGTSSDLGPTADQAAAGDGATTDAAAAADGAVDAAGSSDATTEFVDVPANHAHAEAIAWVAAQGIMKGCDPEAGKFCPDALLSRAAAAVTLMRMKHGETFDYTEEPYFPKDVDDGHWAFKHVQKLKDDKITNGCGPEAFCPDQRVNRAAAAAFLIRAKYGETFDHTEEAYFPEDVDDEHWAFEYVQKLRDDEVTNGCGDKVFCPDTEVTRSVWAVFLFRIESL